MLRVLPYTIGFVPMILTACGLLWGGVWAWGAPLFIFGLIPLLDLVGGEDVVNADPVDLAAPWTYRLHRAVTWAVVPPLFALVLAGAWASTHVAYDPLTLVGLAISVGLCTGGIGITVAHELIHKNGSFERGLGLALLFITAYMHFYIEHLIGHHGRVATPEDPASARSGESLFAFLPRSLAGSFASAWGIEGERLKRGGKGVWCADNRMLLFVALPVAFGVLLAVAWGPIAAAFFACQAVVAFVLLEIVNYVEHYGLQREQLPNGRYGRVGEMHSWSAANRLTNAFLFQLQRHADHHMNGARRYEALEHLPGGPQLPTGYAGMVLLALVPPLWRRVMDPRVAALQQS